MFLKGHSNRTACDAYLLIRACALMLTTVTALGSCAQSAFADSSQEDDDFKSAIQSLCKGKDAEGRYDWKLEGASAHIWVICQSETNVLASINTVDSLYAITMVHTAINRKNPDILSFATYDLSSDGAKIVNGRVKSHAVLRLSIQALRQGMVIGEFQRSPILPVTVNAIRTEPLPSLLGETGLAQDFPFQFSGSFYIEDQKRELFVPFKPPACLVTAIDGDLRSVNLHDSSNLAIWLVWGSSAESGGKVFYATNGVDDALAGKDSVTQVRGVFLTPDIIEFFFFNSLAGLSGPLHAVRMDERVLASRPCQPHLEQIARTPERTREFPSTTATPVSRPRRR